MNCILRYLQRNRSILVKVVVGALVAFVIIFIFIIIYYNARSKNNFCVFETIKPVKRDSQNIASDDLTALVKFTGYLEYPGDKKVTKKYVKLDTKFVSWEQSADSSTLFIEAGCANLTMFIKDDGEGSSLVNFIIVEGENEFAGKRWCTITGPKMLWSNDTHYCCYVPLRFDCLIESKKSKTLGLTLVTQVIEFELDGDREEIKRRVFNNRVSHCKSQQPKAQSR